jgi:hypothetical protein
MMLRSTSRRERQMRDQATASVPEGAVGAGCASVVIG